MKKGILIATLFILVGAVAYVETETSYVQSRLFSSYAQKLDYRVEKGPSNGIIFPDNGPYNERHGYTKLPEITQRLSGQGFEVEGQSRFSVPLLEYARLGGNPPYHEKQQAGLTILDGAGLPLYLNRHPERIYSRFEDIPPMLVNALLFIENRELLDTEHNRRNPAVEWDRLGEVLFSNTASFIDSGKGAAGASTLATQLEKYRHSPDGLTTDVGEKLRQMVSASLRAYRDGPDTSDARHRIVREYLNSTPLAGRAGFGEVQGIGDGLWAWYGIDFDDANRLLREPTDNESVHEQARIFKAALSLLISQRRPSYYLLVGREELARLTDSYLRIMAIAGIIDNNFRDAALSQPLIFRQGLPSRDAPSFIAQKAVNNVRTELLSLLDVKSFYELDRLDLTVKTTVASGVQSSVAAVLQNISNPEFAREMGIIGPRLLDEDQLDAVRFSVVLYESTSGGNKLRVQTDNLDMPFDLNDDSKLDLGSTAKLRTLITYLEIVETLYQRYQGEDVPLLDAASDPLRQWVLTYLQNNPKAELQDILDAAMAKPYSASPYEWFFTAGGRHQFHNFDSDDNYRVMPVSEAFNRSVNLVFIRMMRDISRFYINEIPGIHELLDGKNNTLRQQYLERFADQEGTEYLQRFHTVYRGKSNQEMVSILAGRVRPVAYRLAMAFRSVRPEAPVDAMRTFMASRLPAEELPDSESLTELYEKYGRDKFNSNDRAYLAGVHPLELWLVGYLMANPEASYRDLVMASTDARQDAYRWLFKTRSWNKQQKRIRILVEEDAFEAIHRQWQQLGYPFPSLVPSYATALGVSADRPTALTELMGIIVNDGLRLPMSQVATLHFAEDTPYETRFRATPQVGEQVLSVEIARTVRKALAGIVQSGTARRLADAFQAPDGRQMSVGGKTGTGDHRSKQFGRGGQLIGETVVNRNAIFTFFIDDRFFGTILANVGGPKAKNFDFTSGLAAQLLKSLEPALQPLLLDESESPQETKDVKVAQYE